MQYINITGTSSLIYRLDKVASYVTPSYIFDIENQNTRVNTIVAVEDVSLAPLSYNQFNINNNTLGLTEGEYDLSIYQNGFGLTQITASSSLFYKDELKVFSTASNYNVYASYTQSDSDDYPSF